VVEFCELTKNSLEQEKTDCHYSHIYLHMDV